MFANDLYRYALLNKNGFNVINFIMNYLYLLRLASPLTTSGIIQNARPRFLEAAFLGRVLQPEPIAEC